MSFFDVVYSNTKNTLKRMKPIRALTSKIQRIVVSRAEVLELTRLIEDNRMVVLRPYLQGNATGHLVAHELMREFLDGYQTIGVRKTTMAKIATPSSAVLLRYPLGLLAIPSTYDEYLSAVRKQTRKRIRKAEDEGYIFKEFAWNDHLEDIFKINTSKEVRSGGVMLGWYREPVKPRYLSNEEQHYHKYYGIFKDGNLLAYLYLIVCGDCCFFKHIMGHADHLKNGVMYYLISCVVRTYTGHSHVKWLKYGILPDGAKAGTIDFRENVRLNGHAIFLDLENDQELLKYSRRVQALGLINV